MSDNYKTYREAYDLRKSMGLTEDIEFKYDLSWISGPFSGTQVSGRIVYNDLTQSADYAKSFVPVFSVLLPSSRKMHDKVCRNAKNEGGTVESMESRAAFILLISSTPTILFNDKGLHDHPMVPKLALQALNYGADYAGGDIKHIDGKTITEEIVRMRQGEYEGARVYVDPASLVMHPSQIRPNHGDLLNHRANERAKRELPCGLTRGELAMNGLGEPDLF
jgi:hypothetical protein